MTPEEWPKVRLREIADAIVEIAVPTPDDERPYVALEHLAQGTPTLLGWERAGNATSAKATFRATDLLFGKLRPNLRKAVLAPFDGVCSTDILVIRATPATTSSYLKHLAHWPPLQEHAVRTASGTKMPRTSWALLSEFVFPLPPHGEQRKIATILSAVDDAIQATQAVIDQLQVVKRAMMAELLTRGLPGRHTRFRQTEIGEVPEGWRLIPLDDLIADGPTNGLYKPANMIGRGALVAGMTAIEGSTLRWSACRRAELDESEIARFGMRAGDLLITRVYARVDGIGRFIVVPELPEAAGYESNMMRVRIDRERALPEFVAAHMTLPAVRREIEQRATLGAQASINNEGVRRLPLRLPPLDEQREVVAILGAVDERSAAESAGLDALLTMKAAVMSVLLTGEVRVMPDEVSA